MLLSHFCVVGCVERFTITSNLKDGSYVQYL
jgi:hypothetical protein